jgi:hypothetical protein
MFREHSLTRGSRSLLVLSEIGFGFCGGLFNSARMMVLMACQSSATCEGLLAIGIWALVGAFSGMYPAMSS